MAGELKAAPDCLPCALRQVLDMTRRLSDDPWLHAKVLRQVMKELAGADTDRSPAELSFEALRAAMELLGVRDPYAEDKKKQNAEMLELLPALRRKAVEASDPIVTAARLSIAGNAIDMGVSPGVDALGEIERALSVPLALDESTAFRDAVRSARTVVYVLDNAGEIVLDKLLLEQMKRKDITCVVREIPVLNDATVEDARVVGLDGFCEIVTPGAPMLGLVLRNASGELRKRFAQADLVVSKGQANFETLCGSDKEVFFLLRAKCPITASALGVEVGAAVLTRGPFARAKVIAGAGVGAGETG